MVTASGSPSGIATTYKTPQMHVRPLFLCTMVTPLAAKLPVISHQQDAVMLQWEFMCAEGVDVQQEFFSGKGFGCTRIVMAVMTKRR